MKLIRTCLLALSLFALGMPCLASCALGWRSIGSGDADADSPADETTGDGLPDVDPDTGCPAGWMDCGR